MMLLTISDTLAQRLDTVLQHLTERGLRFSNEAAAATYVFAEGLTLLEERQRESQRAQRERDHKPAKEQTPEIRRAEMRGEKK
jgi:hypothetical protein